MYSFSLFKSKRRSFLFFIVCFALLLSGIYKFIANDKVDEKKQDFAKVIKTEIFNAEDKLLKVKAYGTTDSFKKIKILSQTDGVVIKKVAKSGNTLNKGDPILFIDSGIKQKQLEEAKELLKQRKIEYQANKNLQQKDYVSEIKLQSSLAALKAAESNLKNAEDLLEKKTIKAEITGFLGDIKFTEGDYISAGSVVAEMLGKGKSFISCYVSELDYLKLQKGLKATFKLQDKIIYNGIVSFVDKISPNGNRAFKVNIEASDFEGYLPIGITADVWIESKKVKSYKVPESALFISDEGLIGIKAVHDKVVKFTYIEKLEEIDGFFWVTPISENIKDSIELVVLGGNFVKENDPIDVVQN